MALNAADFDLANPIEEEPISAGIDFANPIEEPQAFSVEDIDLASPLPVAPEVVAEEAVKATYGAAQALEVMGAPTKLDWSDIQNERDRERYTEAQTFRAMAKIAEENGSGTGPGSEAFNLRRRADAVEAEILPHTEAGKRMLASGEGELAAIEQVAASRANDAATTPMGVISSFMGRPLTAAVGAGVEAAGRGAVPALTGAMAAASMIPNPIAPAARAAAPLARALPVGQMIAGLMGYQVGSVGQEAGLQMAETPEETEARRARTTQTEADFPAQTRVGQMAGGLLTFKPSVGEIYKALKGNPEAARNIAVAAGVGAGASVAAEKASGQPVDIANAVVSALENIILNNPTRLGKALGFNVSAPESVPAPHFDGRAPLVDGDAGISNRGMTSTVDAFAGVRRPLRSPEAATETIPPAETPAPAPQEAPAPPVEPPVPPTEPPQPPPAPRGEPAPTSEGPIGIRNAVTETLRKELGLPERVTPELRDFDTLHTEATETLKADPEAGRRLVSELETNPGRMLNDREDAIATFELNARRMARNEASRRVNEAKTPEEREAAMADFLRRDDETIKMIGLLERTGTVSARGLNARRLMIDADYSLSRMLENTRTIRNGGEPLSPEQVTEVTELHAKIADLEKRIAEKETGETAAAARKTFDQVLRQTQREAKNAAKSKKSIVDFLAEKEAEAMARIKARRGKLQTTIDPLNIAGLVDEAIIGAAKIARGVRDFGIWSKQMLADFGERIRPALKGLWDESNKLHAGYETEFNAANAARTPKAIVEKLDPKSAPTQKQVYDLVLAHINEGGTDHGAVIEATRKDLATIYPDITTSQVHQALSQYGKTQIPSQEADKKLAREFKTLSRLERQLEDAINKLAPLKTGPQRDKATANVRELQKKVKDAMQKAGIETRSPEQQLSTSLEAAKTRMRNEIEEMDRAIATKTPRTKNQSQLEYDAEAKALKEKRDDKRKEYESIFGKSEKTVEQRQAEALKALDARIAEEDAMLQAGIAKRPTKPGVPETPEMTKKRAELDAMRKLRRDLAKEEKPAKDESTLARERLAADKKRIRNANEKLRERIRRGDYEPKAKREPVMDEEKLNLLYEKQELQREFNEGLIEGKRAKRGTAKKVFDASGEALNLVRQVLTSADLPPLFRQGLFTVANPGVSAPAVARSINSMLSGRRRFAMDQKVKNNPDYRLAEISGLNLPTSETTSLAKQEEEYAGRLYKNLPRWTVLGPLLRMSERGYNTFISSIRMDLFSKMLRAYGVDKSDLVTTKRVADIINTITGRASLPGKRLEQAAPALNMFLFATRYTASRFKVALGEPLWTGNAKSRAFALEQYGRLLAGAAAIYGVAWMMGAKVETDPRSSNFGKIQVGDTFLDPMAGLTQVTTLMTRLITGETKTTKGGEVVALRDSARPLRALGMESSKKAKTNAFMGGADQVMLQFARTKLAPVVGEAVNLATGSDLQGQPATLSGTPQRVAIPISWQDIYKTMEKQGVPKGAALWILSLFGVGLNNRDKRQPEGMKLNLKLSL